MTKYFISIWFIFACFSCGPLPDTYPQYSYGSDWYVPDSCKNTMRIWIQETIRASSQNLSTSDYEHPEDVLDKLEYMAQSSFKKRSEGLYIQKDKYIKEFVPYEHMTPYEKGIFQKVKP